MKALTVIVASLFVWARVVSPQTISVTTTVHGTSGPWEWVDGGLNTAYEYAYKDTDPAERYPWFDPPTVISTTNGLRFSVGDSLTISYLSGLVGYNLDSGAIDDANGQRNDPLNNYTLPNNTFPAPSYYMDPASYPIYLVELVGTFADSSGQIVGTPFAIGDLGKFSVPAGATQLQLGVNDNGYPDNSGSWNIQITGIAVPEPTTTALVLVSVVVLGLPVYSSYTHH